MRPFFSNKGAILSEQGHGSETSHTTSSDVDANAGMMLSFSTNKNEFLPLATRPFTFFPPFFFRTPPQTIENLKIQA